MKKLIALSLATLVAAAGLAAPAMGQPERKTELVDLGKSTDRIQLRYDMDAGWVVDNQNILYRDTHRDHYLVTLKAACEPLDIRRRPFKFHPSWAWRLLASNSYEVRAQGSAYCDVARIEKVDDARAMSLRDSSRWRIW